jgi:uncharacterized protein YacL
MDSQIRSELHPIEAAQRQRNFLLRILKMLFFVMLLSVTLLAIVGHERGAGTDARFQITMIELWYIPLFGAAALFIATLAVDMLTPAKKISTLSGVFFGLLAGMIATVGISYIIDLLAELWGFAEGGAAIVGTVKVLLGISLCYLGISTVLQTQDDFRLVIPYVEFAKQIRGPRPLLLDTSALIDARIADLAGTGLLQHPVIIPQFVIEELQRLADSQDKLKRARGRRGLEVITRLQRQPKLDLTIDDTIMPGKAVDQMLVEMARNMPATIVSVDVALNRIAGIQGVSVLNLNDVANALKPAVIPGEQLSINLIRPGEQRGQGVGYLEDGTMVVAEDGGDFVGQRVSLTVTSSLQTTAGRLIFGRLNPEPSRPSAQRQQPDRRAREPGPHTAQTEPPAGQAPPPTVALPPAPPAPPESPAADEQPSDAQPGDNGPEPRRPDPPHRPARPNRARNPRR